MIKIDKYGFVLGGVDNEMEEIKRILDKYGIQYIQPQKNWGNIVVDKENIPTDLMQKVLVFIECSPGWEARGVHVIDHHGEFRTKPASLIQVCKLLRIKPNLKQQIIASIDANFLSATMKKFPRKRKYILKLWEEGYKKKFESQKQWAEFKSYCQNLWQSAKTDNKIGLRCAVVWNAPSSMTMIGALADLDSWACLLVCGSPTTRATVPVFFQGNKWVVDQLITMDFEKKYYGKKYFGARAIPAEIYSTIDQLLKLEHGRN